MGIKDQLISYLNTPEAQEKLKTYQSSLTSQVSAKKKQYEEYNNARKEQLIRNRLGENKSLLTPEEQEQFKVFKEYGSLDPLYSGNIGNVYNTKDLNDMLAKYKVFDISKFGDDKFSTAVKNKMTMAGNVGYLPSDAADYYSNLANLIDTQNLNYYGYGGLADPYTSSSYNWRYLTEPAFSVSLDNKSGIYIPAELTNTIWGDVDTGSLRIPYDILGNENIFKYGNVVSLDPTTTSGIVKSLGSQYGDIDYKLKNPELGYWMTQDDFNNYVINANTPSTFNAGTLAKQNMSTGHGTHDTSNLYGSKIYRTTDDIWNDLYLSGADKNQAGLQNALMQTSASGRPSWFTQSTSDPELFWGMGGTKSGASAYDTYLKKNWAAKLTSALKPLATIMSFIPVTAPLGAAMNAGLSIGSGLKTGNLGQIASGVLGYPGVGSGLSSSLTSGLSPTFGSVSPFISSGIISGGLGALSGANPLQSGLAGGLGSYVGSQVSGGLQSANPYLASTLGNVANRYTSSAIMGNPMSSSDTLKNMLIGLIKQKSSKGTV